MSVPQQVKPTLSQVEQCGVQSQTVNYNACRDGALTTSVGKAFQLSTTRNEKKFCLRLEQLHHSPHTKPSIHNIRFIVGACNGSQWKEAWCWLLNVLFHSWIVDEQRAAKRDCRETEATRLKATMTHCIELCWRHFLLTAGNESGK